MDAWLLISFLKAAKYGWSVMVLVWTLRTFNGSEAETTEYVLPVLPYTNYSLDDIVVLPSNAETMELSLVLNGSELLFNLTDDFHIDLPYINSEFQSFETFSDGPPDVSDIILRTSGDANVALNLSDSLLFLSPTRAYGRHFFITEESYKFPQNQTIDVLFQSFESNTTVTLCPFWLEKEKLDAKLAAKAQGFPGMLNCSLMKIPPSGGLVLNNISLLRGIEINSDKPVCILSGYGTNLSSKNAKREQRASSAGQNTPITWNIIPPSERWANQFVIICRPDKRKMRLSILCLQNSTVTFSQDNTTDTLNVTARSVLFKRFDLSDKGYISLTARAPVLVGCRYTEALDVCSKDILALPDQSDNDFSCSDLANVLKYQWIVVKSISLLTMVCRCQANVTLQKRYNGVVFHPSLESLTIANMWIVYIYSFENVSEGTYKLSADTNLEFCYSLFQDVDSDIIQESLQEEQMLNKSLGANSSNFSLMTNESITLTSISTSELWDRMKNQSLEQTTQITSESSDGNKQENQNKILNFITILNSMQDNTISEKTTPPYSKDDLSANDRFNVVVDIVQTNDDTRPLMSYNLEEGNKIGPTYIVNVDSSANTVQDSSGKSLFAVILSLIGALLAVAIFILGFVLNDFLSRRNQCRNTRIRPFVSYY